MFDISIPDGNGYIKQKDVTDLVRNSTTGRGTSSILLITYDLRETDL
jgi:hypothetical protein